MDERGPHSPDDGSQAPTVPGYAVGRRIGVGGTAVVWAATREADGAPVAVKVVTVGADGPAGAAVRELGVLSRVRVEGLVRFHEAVPLPGEDRRVALVLDLVAGGSLEAVVRARGHLSVGESVTVLAPVARTLAGLHEAGVVHGDLTPGNVLLERSGRPLLADLGVARLVGEEPGDAFGTEGFVAPEVMDGGAVTTAADVYAAGALAWWCVTGRAPGPASWRPALDELAPGLPTAWRDTTVQALSSDPMARPSAAEVALAWFDSASCEPLRLVVGADETSLVTHRLRRSVAPAPVTAPPSTRRERLARVAGSRRIHRLPRWPRDRVAAAVAGLGLGVLLLLGGLVATDRLPAPSWLTPAAAPAATVPVATPSPAPAGATTGTAAAPQATASSSVVQRDHGAAAHRTRALMQELADLRARAMTSGKSSDLAAFDAPGSAAHARDTSDLHRLARDQLSYEGVRLVVRSARPVTVTAREVTVDAVVDTAAYRVVSGSAGQQVTRSGKAVRGHALRFALVWSADRWLIEDVAAVG
ncbi:serine/threonine-protein kinase [Pedococcus aerophilus]|uniref:serine/threonine-protein kinase n=1 Tax=Pedococcus aerophilus TaxID=436356 RepID=UPI0031D36190